MLAIPNLDSEFGVLCSDTSSYLNTMQNQNHTSLDDKFTMNFGGFDTDNLFNTTHMGNMGVGMKRSAHDAGLDRETMGGLSSDDDSDFMKKEGGLNATSSRSENMMHHQQTSLEAPQQKQSVLPNGKKTKGRVKIKMEFIDNKLRRYTTFSKRKTGIMKKVIIFKYLFSVMNDTCQHIILDCPHRQMALN